MGLKGLFLSSAARLSSVRFRLASPVFDGFFAGDGLDGEENFAVDGFEGAAKLCPDVSSCTGGNCNS